MLVCFLSKGGRKMVEKHDEWRFLQLRAAQLYEEGNAADALALTEHINQEQIKMLEEACGKYERIENC